MSIVIEKMSASVDSWVIYIADALVTVGVSTEKEHIS